MLVLERASCWCWTEHPAGVGVGLGILLVLCWASCWCWYLTGHPACVGVGLGILMVLVLDYASCWCWTWHPSDVGQSGPLVLERASSWCWTEHPACIGVRLGILLVLDRESCWCWTECPPGVGIGFGVPWHEALAAYSLNMLPLQDRRSMHNDVSRLFVIYSVKQEVFHSPKTTTILGMCAVCLLYVNNLPSTMYADDTAITLGNNSAQLFIKPSNTAPTALASNINKTVSII